MSLVEALPNRLKYILQHIANTEEEEAEEQNIQAFKLIIKKVIFQPLAQRFIVMYYSLLK